MTKNEEEVLHEALHMCYFLIESFDGQICQNETLKKDKELLEAANNAVEVMSDVYQAIGSKFAED